MSRFCRFCGAELRPGARFCRACGREVAAEAEEAKGAAAAVPAAEEKAAAETILSMGRAGGETIITPPRPQAPPSPPPPPRPAQQRLIIRIPGQAQWEVPLSRTAFTMGRKADNDIVIPVDYVSGHHARLELRDGRWHYIDLGSTNGTYVNGQLAQSAVLEDGDILRIGDPQGNSVSLTYREAGGVGAPPPAPAPIRMGTTALGMQTSVLIGRDPQAGINLPAPVVSWHHARLDLTRQGHVLTDLNSTNGTFVNGQRLSRPHLLQQGDVVQIGPFRLVYEAAGFQQYTATGGVRLDGVNLVREVGHGRRKKRILNGIDISIYPREFVALVGTSGAGKTTLMMALNGFNRADGQVMINGDDLYRRFDLYRTFIGYVPQDDIIHRELTVESALRYAARLRLPPDMSSAEIERRVDTVLQQVGMVGQKNQPVSSLSGGQRKRVSIAVELLAEPRLFFLDEPTSGLDPGLEKKMMHTLRQLADGGRTVVLVTHATANIAQCDHVCFLSQGRMVYFGPPEEAFQFFEVSSGDFADIYGKLDDPNPAEARRLAAEWEERFRRSPYYQRYVADRQGALLAVQQEAVASAGARKRPRVNSLRQFLVLTRRYLDLVFRDRLLLTVLLAIMPVIGLLLLLITQPNWLVGDTGAEIQRLLNADLEAGQNSATYMIVDSSQRLLFMMALAAVLLGLFAAAYEIVKERSIYQRERMVTLRLIPYLASKVVVLGAFALAQCLLLLLVIGLKVDFPVRGVFLPAPLEMYLTLIIATLAAIMMGLFVSSVVPNTNTVIYVVLVLLFFQILFAGVIFKLPDTANQLSKLTLTRWTMEGLGTSADMEYLNSLTRTRFQPDPITEEVSFQVEQPAKDWEPVTVVTETQEIQVPVQPGIYTTVPISVPHVTVNDMVTVTETVTEEVTVTPDPIDISGEREFQIDYAHTRQHLLNTWATLLAFAGIFGTATLIVLKRKDVG